jgi:hypothetical protein
MYTPVNTVKHFYSNTAVGGLVVGSWPFHKGMEISNIAFNPGCPYHLLELDQDLLYAIIHIVRLS